MKESNYLKDSIENIQKLFSIPALNKFETKSLGRLIRQSKVRQYEDGECIIREGDNDKWIYEGMMEMAIAYLKDRYDIPIEIVDITTISKHGEMFGEMQFLDNLSRSASVFASGPTTCLAVNTEVTDRLPTAGEAGNFLLLLYRATAEYVSVRLRITTDELVKVKNQLEAVKKTLS